MKKSKKKRRLEPQCVWARSAVGDGYLGVGAAAVNPGKLVLVVV